LTYSGAGGPPGKSLTLSVCSALCAEGA
jgi:hypothetical protein